jgi:hypothetical protein
MTDLDDLERDMACWDLTPQKRTDYLSRLSCYHADRAVYHAQRSVRAMRIATVLQVVVMALLALGLLADLVAWIA